jgi:hypothetical protein
VSKNINRAPSHLPVGSQPGNLERANVFRLAL